MTYSLALHMSSSPGRRYEVRNSFAARSTCLVFLALFGLVGSACKSKSRPSGTGNVATTAKARASTPATRSSISAPTRSFVMPAGPAFAIEAGEGLGPVRFGATVATIERLMEAKCDELTEKYCRYVAAGIEYELKDGVVSGIVVYRHDRPVVGSPSKIWGRTRCAIRPDLTPRVILSYVHANLGKPESTEVVSAANPNRTALRETYPGLVLEYDRGEYTNELIVGSIRILKLDNPPKPKPVPTRTRPPEPLH